MQKVYLLLRNNQQTGPYTFEELLHLQLKPFDLIWVEGKSYGWRYPNEVEALKPYVAEASEPDIKENIAPKPAENLATSFTPASKPNVNSNKPKNIFVSLPENPVRPQTVNNDRQTAENTSYTPTYQSTYQPATYQNTSPPTSSRPASDPIEQKAEELRRRAQAYMQKDEGIKTNYSRGLNEAEEDYTNWMFQQKTKKKSSGKKYLPAVALCCLLVAGGWWTKAKFFSAALKSTETAEVKNNNATEKKNDVPEQNSLEEVSSVPNENATVAEQSPKQKTGTASKKKNIQNETIAKDNNDVVKQPVPVQSEPIVTEPEINKTTEEENKIVVQAPAEKKKTIKEKLSELFKKKEDKPVTEGEPRSADNNSNGRNATRREEETQSPVTTDVSGQVEIKTNKIADSWMIGVKNLKLTLYNRSDLTISAAKVEVLYYTEQNTVVDKKILSYNNIPPKKSQTVAAPDQRLADHIEYRVISATGVDNAYATR